jgi:hypothetical protein
LEKKTRRVDVGNGYYYLVEYEIDFRLFQDQADVKITVPVYKLDNGKPVYIRSFAGKSGKPKWYEKLMGITYDYKLRFTTDNIESQVNREIKQMIHFENVVDIESKRK